MRFGDVEVLVEATQLGGNEATSAIDRASGQVADVVDRVRSTVRAVAESVTGMAADLAASRVARPEHIEVEIGLGFSVKGSVVLVAGGADASLKITLAYTLPPVGGGTGADG
jgi:hypothetical protein